MATWAKWDEEIDKLTDRELFDLQKNFEGTLKWGFLPQEFEGLSFVKKLREERYVALTKVWADYDKKVREVVGNMVIEGEPVGTSPREKVIAAINTRIAHYETRRVEMERKDPDAKSVHYVDGNIDGLRFALNLVQES